MKKFLSKQKVIAAAIAALTSGGASAMLPESAQVNNQLNNLTTVVIQGDALEKTEVFTLHRNEVQQNQMQDMHAYHSSHASHGSHGSHSSHASSRY